MQKTKAYAVRKNMYKYVMMPKKCRTQVNVINFKHGIYTILSEAYS